MKLHHPVVIATALFFNLCINNVSSQSTATAASATTVTGNAERGQELFSGNIRFANDGPTCNSCHNVNMKDFVSGGALAKDLTQSVSRLTAEGVKGVMSGLPFPQMRQSYQGKPLTGQELADITAFLKKADELSKTQPENTIGTKMLIGGIGGVIFLLALFTIFWIKRKQRTVNYSIYKRQIKSA